jgi:TolA-binding protein
MTALLLLALAAVPSASAQMQSREAISLQDQILELRHELQMMQAQQGGGAPSPSYAQPANQAPPAGGTAETVTQLLTRVGALEDQMRELRGRVDELNNTVQQMSADLNKQIGDLKFQMQNPQVAQGGPAAANPGPAPTPQSPPSPSLGTLPESALPATPAATAPPPQAGGPRTSDAALQEGYAAFGRRDYATAQQDAQEILNKRASPQAYDAQYLLAQSLAGQHLWSRAAIAYDDTYNRAPKGGHAQEALLGLANSLTAINEKRAACDTLAKLHTEFPRPRTELRSQISAAYQRAGCRV